jgi:hypothetical protein
LQEELDEYVHSCKENDLGTAYDSLIDLVYVACGTALLHGYDPDKFDVFVENFMRDISDDFLYDGTNEPYREYPSFLSPAENLAFTQYLQDGVNMYREGHAVGNITIAMNGIASLYVNCIIGAASSGLSEEAWNEMWDDVQRANMQKERVLKAEDSKRGSTWDVRKPPGWVGPRTDEILQKYLKHTTVISVGSDRFQPTESEISNIKQYFSKDDTH